MPLPTRSAACPACHHEVPVGRWCNWCGAALRRADEGDLGGRRPRPGPFVAGALVALAGVAVVVVPRPDVPSAPAPPPDAPVEVDVPVARAPREVPVVPREPVDRADVVCSDLSRQSVPVDLLPDTAPGTVVELAQGPCVVMGTEGAVVP